MNPINTAGVYSNSVTPTAIQTGPGGTSTASITVLPWATLSMQFGAASIPLNGSTSLTFTIQNINPSAAASGVAFTDILPAGLAVATPNGLTGTCGGGVITANAAATQVALAGATLAIGASCTFSVNVTGTGKGVKNNSTQASSINGGASTASASLVVVAPPTISKAFGAPSIPLAASMSLTFLVQNSNTTASLAGVGFSDTLPPEMMIATPSGLTGSGCGGTIMATQGAGVVSLTGATIGPLNSCTFSVNVIGTSSGSKNNVTGSVISGNGGTGNMASASLNVMPTLTVVTTSNFNPSALGQTVVFTTTVLGSGATPTGTVNFFDGAMPLCSAVGLISGQASCVYNNLPTGLRSITAGYSGDANYGAATSPPYMQTVGSATSRILTVTKGGTGSGTVTSNPSGINCGADCTEPYANATLVTLTATPTAGSVFMGWLGACVGTVPCTVNVTAATSVSATFAPSTVLPRIDIDGNNAYDAPTDGLLMVCYLFGFTGASLTNGAIGTGPARSSPTDIAQYMDNIKPLMDVDGNGQTDALTDGLMLLRHLLGIRGPSLTTGAIGFGATRPVTDISAYIQSIRP